MRKLIDFDEPVAVLLLGVLQFVGDDADPLGCVAALRDAVAPGSYLAITHATSDGQPTEVLEAQKRPAAPRPRSCCAPRTRSPHTSTGVRWSNPVWCICRCGGPTIRTISPSNEQSGAYGGVASKI